MSEPKYNEAIKVGLKFTWQHKSVWFYGFFISILGQFGIFEFLSKITLVARGETPSSLFWYFYSSLSGIKFSNIYLSVSQWSWLFWVLAFLFAFALVFVYIAIVSQGALIKNAATFFDTGKYENISLSWHAGAKKFWPVFFLNILKKGVLSIVIFSLIFVLAEVLFLNSWWSDFLFIFSFLLVSLIGILVSFLMIYAIAFVITEDKNFKEAIKLSWHIFKKHWLVSFEVGFIMILANLLLFLLAILGLYIFLFPSILLMFGVLFSANVFFSVLCIIFGVLTFAIYLILISSLFNVFNVSVWTFLFIKMRREGIVSRILSWFKK
ncbi:MAG: hypothetical protein WC414_03130 [Patescibacteria group bacterium]